MDDIFFPFFKSDFPMSPYFHKFCLEVSIKSFWYSFVENESFFSGLSFFFLSVFRSFVYSDVPRYGSLCIYSAWNSSRFLNLWKFFSCYIFKYWLFLSSFTSSLFFPFFLWFWLNIHVSSYIFHPFFLHAFICAFSSGTSSHSRILFCCL